MKLADVRREIRARLRVLETESIAILSGHPLMKPSVRLKPSGGLLSGASGLETTGTAGDRRRPDAASRSSSVTLTADTALASIPLEVGRNYEIDGMLLFTAASGTPDAQFGLRVPIGAALDVAYFWMKTGSLFGSGLLTMNGSASSRIEVDGTDVTVVWFTGTVATDERGDDLDVLWSQATSSGDALTLGRGSYLTARLTGTDAIVTAGRDMRPPGYINCNAYGAQVAPEYASFWKEVAGQGGGPVEAYNYLIGEAAHVGGVNFPSGRGFARPFNRFMLWMPKGSWATGLGTFVSGQHGAGLPWLNAMYQDAIAYTRTTGGKPTMRIDAHIGIACNSPTSLETNRLYDPALDTWWAPEHIQLYKDDGWDGCFFIDAGYFFESLTNAARLVSPLSLGWEGIPHEAGGDVLSAPMLLGPAWASYQLWLANGGTTWTAPGPPHFEAIVFIAVPPSESTHATNLANLVYAVEHGFVLGASPNTGDAGTPFYAEALLFEAYATAGVPIP